MRKANLEKLKLKLDSYELKYVEEILNIPRLSNDELLNLVKKVKNGDLEARKKLLYHNLYILLGCGNTYSDNNIEIFDLIHDGSFAIIKAAEKYDIDSNCNLRTWFIIYVRTYILNCIVKYNQIVPSNVYYTYLNYINTKKDLESKLNRKVSHEEIVSASSVSDKSIKVYKQHFDKVDIITPMSEYSDIVNINMLNYIENRISLNNDFKKLYKRARLSQIEIEVFELYYGLNNNEGKTLDEIADMVGCSHQYISQLKDSALQKIIMSNYINNLSIYMDNPTKALENLEIKRKSLKK